MNLKEASRTLGVHYQTAYKWVRSGSLTAIRIGARYEVSQAAIDQFLATRRSVLLEAQPASPTRRATDLDLEDVIEEFEAMAADPVMTARSITNFAARRGAKVLGDLCLVVVADDDRANVRQAVVDHPVPAHAAFVSAFLGATDKNLGLGPNLLADTFNTGQPVLVPHVSQDLLRAGTRPDMRQYIAEYPIYSLLAAPIVAGGRPLGFIAFSRDTADHPYGPADQQFAVVLGERIGALLVTAAEIASTWITRRALVGAVGVLLTDREPDHRLRTADFVGWADANSPGAGPMPVLIFDEAGVTVFANDAATRVSGHPRSTLIGQTFDAFTSPEDLTTDRANFAKLTSGELDYLDTNCRRVRADGTVFHFASHRAAVRHPDASLACVLTVARPLHIPTIAPPLLVGAS